MPKIEEEIRFLLIPKDPDDAKNVVVEVRAGTGGDEASIFAGDLFRMYTKYCESKGWKVDVVDYSEGTNGGFKEIQFEVVGEDVYGTLKFEAGVHRVQRVPQTETQGRVHTSAATVIVLPEALLQHILVHVKKRVLLVEELLQLLMLGQELILVLTNWLGVSQKEQVQHYLNTSNYQLNFLLDTIGKLA